MPEGITGLLLITAIMDSHEKAPRPSHEWPGPWSTLMLHEFEQLRFDKRAATAPNDIYDDPASSSGSPFYRALSVLVFALVLATITFLDCILLLVSPSPRWATGWETWRWRSRRAADVRNKRNRLRRQLCRLHCLHLEIKDLSSRKRKRIRSPRQSNSILPRL